MFAALIIDRDPYTFGDFPGLAQAWFQDAGGFLFLGLLFYLLISITRPQVVPNADASKKGVSGVSVLCAAAATLLYAGYGLMLLLGEKAGLQAMGLDLLNVKQLPDPNGYVKIVPPRFSLFGYTHADLPAFLRPAVPDPGAGKKLNYPWQALLLTLGGVVSFVGATAPMALGLVRLRGRRIWAVAVLCIKEVVRNRVFVAFLFVFVVLLFPINWFIQSKPGNELRDVVKWLAPITAVLLVLPAVLMSAYALPNDVKNQNIYTLVTKPMERFEIVLGRFTGYTLLFSGVVAVVALITLLTTVASNPSQLAWQETGTARVPTYGKLSYLSRKGASEGVDVGREFNYRKYIGGDPNTTQRAVYSISNPPSGMKRMPSVPVEFSFDIYRLTKGEENKGVQVNLRVTTANCPQQPPGPNDASPEWRWADREKERAYRAEALAELRKVPEFSAEDKEDAAVRILTSATPDANTWPAANALARKYGYFEYRGKELFDFHPERVELPAGLFENAAEGQAAGPRLTVSVHCTTASQMLGTAEGDLYLLEAEQYFWWNHLKGSLTVWFWAVLVIGLAVTLSTYLDFVVTLLVVLFLFIPAFFANYIDEMGRTIGQTGPGGQAGPVRSLGQLLEAKQSTALPEGTAGEKAADIGDVGFAWGFRRVLNLLPDVQSFGWTNYVAEGFNIPLECLVMNLVVLVAYLFPWFLLSYYLIRGREVAA